MRGGKTLAGRRRICEVDARGNEPRDQRWVCNSHQEPPDAAKKVNNAACCAVLRAKKSGQSMASPPPKTAPGCPTGMRSSIVPNAGPRVKDSEDRRRRAPKKKADGAGCATADGGGDGALSGTVRSPSPLTRKGDFTTR